jgi:hypothetical protein
MLGHVDSAKVDIKLNLKTTGSLPPLEKHECMELTSSEQRAAEENNTVMTHERTP